MFLRKNPSKESDEDLLRRFRSSNDLEALGNLYLRYAPLVYGVCLKHLRDREASKDAVMQIHEKLINLLHKHEVSHFRSWLYTLTRNHCLMQLRSTRGHIMEDIDSVVMENILFMHPDGDSRIEENLQKLERCIDKLIMEQQQCVRLFFLQEKSYKDICMKTGFEMKLVKSYIQNGKRNLKICMESNG